MFGWLLEASVTGCSIASSNRDSALIFHLQCCVRAEGRGVGHLRAGHGVYDAEEFTARAQRTQAAHESALESGGARDSLLLTHIHTHSLK